MTGGGEGSEEWGAEGSARPRSSGAPAAPLVLRWAVSRPRAAGGVLPKAEDTKSPSLPAKSSVKVVGGVVLSRAGMLKKQEKKAEAGASEGGLGRSLPSVLLR